MRKGEAEERGSRGAEEMDRQGREGDKEPRSQGAGERGRGKSETRNPDCRFDKARQRLYNNDGLIQSGDLRGERNE